MATIVSFPDPTTRQLREPYGSKGLEKLVCMEEKYQILWGFCKKPHGTPGLFLGLKVHPIFIDNYPWIDMMILCESMSLRYNL